MKKTFLWGIEDMEGHQVNGVFAVKVVFVQSCTLIKKSLVEFISCLEHGGLLRICGKCGLKTQEGDVSTYGPLRERAGDDRTLAEVRILRQDPEILLPGH